METEIIELERATREAILRKDTAFFEDLLADDFVFVTPQGLLVNKLQDIDQYHSGDLNVQRFDVDEMTVRVSGASAISRFRVVIEGQFKQYAFLNTYRFSRVYEKQGPHWRMVAGHSSEIVAAHP